DPDLVDFTDAELATYERVRRNEVIRHQQKYPDCQDYEAVWEDADRHAKWWVGHKKWWEEKEKLSEEWMMVMTENDELYENLRFNMSPKQRRQYFENLSEAERTALTTRVKTWKKREEAVFQRYDEFKKEKPIEPKPRHTH
ncbi:MAG: hypothetical protein OXG97_05635, partial [Candidatus Poribacteria bacterium]|nr:hypothetical protein [Candidatus Poribacteria bacterium]